MFYMSNLLGSHSRSIRTILISSFISSEGFESLLYILLLSCYISDLSLHWFFYTSASCSQCGSLALAQSLSCFRWIMYWIIMNCIYQEVKFCHRILPNVPTPFPPIICSSGISCKRINSERMYLMMVYINSG